MLAHEENSKGSAVLYDHPGTSMLLAELQNECASKTMLVKF